MEVLSRAVGSRRLPAVNPGRSLLRVSVRLNLGENPQGGLSQMTCDGADGNGMASAPADALIENRNMLVAPDGIVPFPDDNVGGLREYSGTRYARAAPGAPFAIEFMAVDAGAGAAVRCRLKHIRKVRVS